jgi:hypothetical protein
MPLAAGTRLGTISRRFLCLLHQPGDAVGGEDHPDPAGFGVHGPEDHELVAHGKGQRHAGRVDSSEQAHGRRILHHAVDQRHFGQQLVDELRGQWTHPDHDHRGSTQPLDDALAVRPVAVQVVLHHRVRAGRRAHRLDHGPPGGCVTALDQRDLGGHGRDGPCQQREGHRAGRDPPRTDVDHAADQKPTFTASCT